DLLVGERPLLDPAQRLALHELAEQLHDGQDQADQPPLDRLRVGVDPAPPVRHGHGWPASGRPANEYGGHGPVISMRSSPCCPASSSTAAAKSPSRSSGSR